MIKRRPSRRLPIGPGVAVAALVLLAGPAAADTWTNAAGGTIEALAVEFDGRTVVLRRPTGEEVRLPLFCLAKEEQRRVKELFNGPPIPAVLQPAYNQAVVQLERARLLLGGGQMSTAEYAARRGHVIRSLERACAALSYPANSDQVRQLVARLSKR